MANAIDPIKFKPDEAFDGKKMDTFAAATKEGFDLTRSEINELQRGKIGIVERGYVTEPGQIDISDVPNFTMVSWQELGNNYCLGIVIGGEIRTIFGRR